MTQPQDITAALYAAGLKRGDHLIVHSSLRAIGPVEGGADGMIDALLQTVGDQGTLAMPAFNYTRPVPTPYFDPAITPGATGALGETFRKREGTLRSMHPAHSVCAAGPRAAEFLADHDRHGSFGVDSPFDRIAAAGGWTLLAGVSQTANSMIHVAESHAGMKKFWWNDGQPPRVKTLYPDGRIAEVPLDVSSSCSMAFNVVEQSLRQADAIRDLMIGGALSYLMRAGDVIAVVKELLFRWPTALFCTRPGCRPCRLGRAAGMEK